LQESKLLRTEFRGDYSLDLKGEKRRASSGSNFAFDSNAKRHYLICILFAFYPLVDDSIEGDISMPISKLQLHALQVVPVDKRK